ncbi:MAG TPA: protoporphyrinogen oxidase [Armatimonadota bacterium]|jgi:oxygen-dependent protoporphyrinogen oxidase
MRVVVVGAGITGLSAAYYLTRLAGEKGVELDLRVLDGASTHGGVLQSHLRDGFVTESGPDSFITDKPWAVRLSEELGLKGDLQGTNNTFRRAFVVNGGRLQPVPEGFQLLAPSRLWPFAFTPIFSWPGKIRMGLDLIIPPKHLADGKEVEDESLGSFVQRRLGREALERMAQPMVGGIYGGDPDLLSLKATLPRFLEMERKHGSVIRALWEGTRRRPGRHPGSTGVSGARYGLFATYRQGLQTVTSELRRRLPKGALRLNTQVRTLRHVGPPESGEWQVVLADGDVLSCDAVCLCLQSNAAAPLLREVDTDLASRLADVAYASAATVNFAYKREDVGHALNGFGFVAPLREGQAVLGCTFASVKYYGRAPEGYELLRAFVGEPMAQEADDSEVEVSARADLERLLGITGKPLWTEVSRHPKAMAQYHVGHLRRVEEIEEATRRHPGLALAGNGFRGIGLPDCIRSAELAARRLLG